MSIIDVQAFGKTCSKYVLSPSPTSTHCVMGIVEQVHTPTSSSQGNEQHMASNYSQQLELEKHEILNISGKGEVDIMYYLMFNRKQVTTNLLRNCYMY
jgi:hypothetical protein